ncbi:hypothetical protein LshimejAT787_0900430 [Lyophyllum shimeji]|uniref:Uncharacterized protein n=1 Tax=Lyophyllum shimeji TaxID=47721 RepID=A0A9P3PRR3_LYOSH|nr:hypothetical protein LshimejAT787_0900430 [Lyophyllum shimeji]
MRLPVLTLPLISRFSALQQSGILALLILISYFHRGARRLFSALILAFVGYKSFVPAVSLCYKIFKVHRDGTWERDGFLGDAGAGGTGGAGNTGLTFARRAKCYTGEDVEAGAKRLKRQLPATARFRRCAPSASLATYGFSETSLPVPDGLKTACIPLDR